MRRHHVSAALGEILATMPPRPTDSVLRRHFDASVAVALAERVGPEAAALLARGAWVPASAGPPAPGAPAAAGRATHRPAAAAASPESPKRGGGLFGWLKRLFGG